MKKILCFFIVALIFIFCSCENNAAGDNLSVVYRNVDIQIGAKADEVIEQLGNDYSYSESESCAYQGKDKIYEYPDIEIYTYPKNNVDYILSVVFLNDTVETKEKITIGASTEDIIKAYGKDNLIFLGAEGYENINYEKGDSKIMMLMREGEIYYLEYTLIAE
jgi:hypothetical protein